MQAFISDIKIQSKSEFATKFNHVSDLWQIYKEAKTEKEQREAFDNWFNAKLALEQGW